jgi:hypothetical protein
VLILDGFILFQFSTKGGLLLEAFGSFCPVGGSGLLALRTGKLSETVCVGDLPDLSHEASVARFVQVFGEGPGAIVDDAALFAHEFDVSATAIESDGVNVLDH